MDGRILLKIARDAIGSKFDNSVSINKKQLLEDYPFLQELGATFVTLNLDGNLRGCIGTLEARHTLLDDLVANSNNAAFHDPRFYELSYDEFQRVEIEVSVLSKPVKLEYKDTEDLKLQIKPYIHGVILDDGLRSSTFLPQVWEQLPSFEEFFSHLCSKGNFESNCLLYHPDVYVYEVQKVK